MTHFFDEDESALSEQFKSSITFSTQNRQIAPHRAVPILKNHWTETI